MADQASLQMETPLTNRRVVAVDGGTATGKGRLIAELAALMRSHGVPVIHLSTGSIYRAGTYVSLEYELARVKGRRALSDRELMDRAVALLRELPAATIVQLMQERHVEMHGGVVWLDGAPMTEVQLKGPGVGNGVATVAAWSEVRAITNTLTRRQVNEFDGYVLIDGRDITHTVVPDAPLKLLLTVAPQIAARRSLEHTEAEIVARDTADREHRHGALRSASNPGDSVRVLATDDHTPESVRDHVYRLMREVWPELPTH